MVVFTNAAKKKKIIHWFEDKFDSLKKWFFSV